MVELAPRDDLYRRLPAAAAKGTTVTSGAFKTNNEYDQEISVHIAKLLESSEDVLCNRPFHGVGVFTVENATRPGFTVRHDPLPGDEAHALLIGEKAKARELADRRRMVIAPEPKP